MKKVLFIFILMVFFNLITVDAITIITTTGTDKTAAITENNDQITPSIYNWNKEFDYPINYYDAKEGRLIPSLFSLNEENTLKNGKVFTSLLNKKDDGKDYQICKILPIENDKYLMFGALKINDNFVPVINYYEKNILIWQYTYSNIGRGRFVSGVLGDGVIHCLGEYEQFDSFTTDILVLEISLTGVLNQMKLIKGNKNAKAHEIYNSKDGIYFVTETPSYTLDYQGVNQMGIGVFLSKLTYNFEVLKMFCVKNFQGADYLASFMADDKLIVYLAVKGMGPFPYIAPEGYTEAFVSLDKYAEDIEYNKLNENYYMDHNFLLSDQNSYYIGGYDCNKNEIIVSEYSKDFRYKTIRYFNIFNSDELVININNVKIEDNHILIINTQNIFSGNHKYYYFCINKYMKRGDILTFEIDGEEFKNIFFCDNYIYLAITKRINNHDVLYVYKIGLIKLYERIYMRSEKMYFSTFMTINYKEIESIKVCYQDVNSLKTNNYFLVQNDGDFMCINEAKVKMLPSTNIEEGTIYDLEKKIIFNGKGYLNNQEILSGYVIKTPGFYSLKQESEEGEIYLTEFNVENLKTIIIEEKIINGSNIPVISNDKIKEAESRDLKLNGQVNINSLKKDFRIYIFILSVLLFSGFAFLLPKKLLRRNKK